MERKSDPLFVSTLRSHNRGSGSAHATLPCLTILGHPDPTRVGQRAALRGLLVGEVVELSRTKPTFARPGDAQGAPLGDPHLSRSALRLATNDQDELVVDPCGTEARADGAMLSAARAFGATELARGVVLELGQHAVLLLHRCTLRPLTKIAGLLGQSDAIEDVRRELVRVADLTTPVLVRGETGTGKERIAEAIHACSPRARAAFVAINMATVPESVAVSTLFGHARGAFTGAQQRHHGLFERAAGGTLLLDEIGETPENVQPMLLRAVETGKVLPLGDEAEREVDVRFIAATDSDLERELRGGSFSAALLHRLSGYEIHSPPLRERREDIALLLVRFLEEELAAVAESARLAELFGLVVRSGFLAQLVQHPLPGNVRQLRNVARHLVISNRGRSEPTITAAVQRQLERAELPVLATPSRPSAPSRASAPPPASVRPTEISEERMLAALRDNAWSPNRTAASLGIPTGTLHDLMRKSSKVRRAADLADEELRAALEASAGDTHAAAATLCVSERGLRLMLRQRGLLDA